MQTYLPCVYVNSCINLIKVVTICWCLFEWERSASKRIEKTLFSAFVSETYWLERKQVECYNDFNVKTKQQLL